MFQCIIEKKSLISQFQYTDQLLQSHMISKNPAILIYTFMNNWNKYMTKIFVPT